MAREIIQHSKPSIGEEEIIAAGRAVRSGYLSQGKKVEELEGRLAEFFGVRGAVAVNSGTSALHLSLLGLGISVSSEVLLPSYVCSAPMNAVYYTSASPVLCDIDARAYNIDPGDINGKKTDRAKAVIVPHIFGNVADLERIGESGLTIIEDCAHSAGAMYGEKPAGSVGKASILSFYANKMLGCGEGGALLSDDSGLLNAARDLRDYDEKEIYRVRYNYKMTDIQAAIGLVQLKKLPGFVARRKEIAGIYTGAFSGLDIVLPEAEFDHVYYRYVIKTKNESDRAVGFFREKGIMAAKPVFKPLHRLLETRPGFRNTDEAYACLVSIPLYPSLTDKEISRVIEAVKAFFG
ncbi:MAG: DegT/DnrJ/EryC1/StrS aminotransferase family protein [Candidatus Omnitrophota bacterium]